MTKTFSREYTEEQGCLISIEGIEATSVTYSMPVLPVGSKKPVVTGLLELINEDDMVDVLKMVKPTILVQAQNEYGHWADFKVCLIPVIKQTGKTTISFELSSCTGRGGYIYGWRPSKTKKKDA